MPKQVRKVIGGAIVRVYAFAIMAVVLWAGYTAVTYLYRSVFQPMKSPEALLEWQGQTSKEALREAQARGITDPATRAPLGHYHGVDRWFQPDIRNGCISSGCHDPIPHSHSKALRAFANLHSTFMTCDVCHRATEARPIPAAWISMRTGDKQEPPAILRLIGHLGSEQIAAMIREPATSTQPAAELTAFSRTTIQLLREAIDVYGGDPVLNYLSLQIETSEPGSPVWRQAIQQLKSELPNHARGEYGAKIALTSPPPESQPIRQDYTALITEYFSRDISQNQREAVKQKLHEGVIEAPEGCTPCHRARPPVLDFEALGYPPERIKKLTSTPIAEMMQRIHSGQPFNLPLAP